MGKMVETLERLNPACLRKPVGDLTIYSPRYQIDQRIHELLQIRRKQGFLDILHADERVYLRSIARRQQREVLREK